MKLFLTALLGTIFLTAAPAAAVSLNGVGVQGCAIDFALCVADPFGGGTGDGTLSPFFGNTIIGAGEEFRFDTNISTIYFAADFVPTETGADLIFTLAFPTQVVPLTLGTNTGWYFTFTDPSVEVTVTDVIFPASRPLLVSAGNIDFGPHHLAVEFDSFPGTSDLPKTVTFKLAAVPEPTTGTLFAFGLIGLAARRRHVIR